MKPSAAPAIAQPAHASATQGAEDYHKAWVFRTQGNKTGRDSARLFIPIHPRLTTRDLRALQHAKKHPIGETWPGIKRVGLALFGIDDDGIQPWRCKSLTDDYLMRFAAARYTALSSRLPTATTITVTVVSST